MSKSNFQRGITLAFCLYGFFSSASACAVLAKDSLHWPDTPESYQLLYNGRAWKNHYPSVEGHQFFLSDDYFIGSVTVRGKTFANIPLMYDLLLDEILTPMDDGTILQVNREMVDSFTVFRQGQAYRFARWRDGNTGSPGGYMRVLYGGQTPLYIKYAKKIDRPAVENKTDNFYQVSRIYLVKNGTIHPVTGRNELLGILKDRQAEIKSYISKSHIKLSVKEPERFIPVLEYYDSLHTAR